MWKSLYEFKDDSKYLQVFAFTYIDSYIFEITAIIILELELYRLNGELEVREALAAILAPYFFLIPLRLCFVLEYIVISHNNYSLACQILYFW